MLPRFHELTVHRSRIPFVADAGRKSPLGEGIVLSAPLNPPPNALLTLREPDVPLRTRLKRGLDREIRSGNIVRRKLPGCRRANPNGSPMRSIRRKFNPCSPGCPTRRLRRRSGYRAPTPGASGKGMARIHGTGRRLRSSWEFHRIFIAPLRWSLLRQEEKKV